MLLNINATRGPTACCSATHGLLLSQLLLKKDTKKSNIAKRVGQITPMRDPKTTRAYTVAQSLIEAFRSKVFPFA